MIATPKIDFLKAFLRVLSGRQTSRILSAYGFVEVRRRGSHIAMQKTDVRVIITFLPRIIANCVKELCA